MKDKIKQILELEGLTTTRLAEILEIQPSTVSHLIAGRNKPGYDLIQKILKQFPKIDPDWLFGHSTTPYRPTTPSSPSSQSASASASTLFDSLANGDAKVELVTAPTPGPKQQQVSQESEVASVAQQSATAPKIINHDNVRSASFIVIFYDDGSCERFSVR